MGLNIKNPEVERLAAEVAIAIGVSKTEAIRRALLDCQRRLALRQGTDPVPHWKALLERDVWSQLPEGVRGKRVPREAFDNLFD